MKAGIVITSVLALIASGAAFAQDGNGDLVARGKYLAIAGDCAACHTTPGQAAFAGGRPIETPFGTMLAANITPDPDTGIGKWSDDAFVAAVTQGKGEGGMHLYPAMPYTYYSKASRDDVLAIFAYLKTIPPVKNEVHENQLPFPFNQRWAMVFWNGLFFHPRPVDAAGQSDVWARGAYLVEGLGHCGACHTPKNFLGADQHTQTLWGATLQDWHATNLSGDERTGLGRWSADDIAAFLKVGHNDKGDVVGSMSEVIADSTSQLTDADLRAIATYLKAIPAHADAATQKVAEDTPAMRAGAAIFHDSCTACHGGDGRGQTGLFAPLDNSEVVQAADPTTLIRIVLEGVRSAGTEGAPTAPAMPSYAWKLTDLQIAAVVTYIRNAWHNAAGEVSADTVGKLRKRLVQADKATP